MTNFPRRAGWALFLPLGLLVLAALGVRLGASWYLRSDRFRKQITAAVGHVLKAEGDFQPFHYTDGIFYSDGYAAQGKRAAFFSDLRADQTRAVVNWRGLLDRRWEIDELNVQNLDLRLGQNDAEEAKPAPPRSPKKESRWKLDLRKATVARSSWHWGSTPATEGSISGSAFTLQPNHGAWLIDVRSGQLTQTGWPSLTIDSAKLRYTGPSLFVSESTLRAGAGRLAVNGEIKFKRAADLQARFDHVDITPLLPSDWRARLHGILAGTLQVHAPLPHGDPEITGNLRLSEGQLEALPLLDQIATFTRTERFRHVALTEGSASIQRAAGTLTINNLLLESPGLLRLKGGCTIARERIDGQFQIGVTAASLQWLPGSQARVFTAAHDGYLWTSLHLSGPVAHPHEDLTKRLIAAAAGELLKNSDDTLRDAAKALLELIPH